MANSEDILVSNLTESLKAVQNCIMIGTGTALFFLLLVLQESSGVVKEGEKVVVPVFGFSAETNLAAIIAVSICWVSGVMATEFISRSYRILEMLRPSKEIFEAALTYPSIPTIRAPGWRIGGALLPGLLVMAGSFLRYSSIGSIDYETAFKILFIGLPYLLLAILLARPLGCLSLGKIGD